MNERPLSIWRKPFKSPLKFITVFLICLLLGVMVALAVLYLATAPGNSSITTLVVSVVLALACVTLLALFIRWLRHWRNLRRVLIGLACFATLIGLFYTVENWHGQHAWKKFRREWEAKGEKVEPRDFIPAPVPDDQNFALTPIVASSYAAYFDKDGHEIIPRKTNVVNRLRMLPGDENNWNNWPSNSDWTVGIKTDLRAWQQYYRELASKTNLLAVPAQPGSPAADVLLALSKYDSTVEELREAAKLPYSRFPLIYGMDDPAMILLPHLSALKGCSMTLQLRASAELQNGQSDLALADVKLCLRLVDSVHTEPLLISHLVRIAMVQIAIQPVYEGVADHRWTDAQLVKLNSELSKLDFLADYKFSTSGDVAFIGVSEFDYLERTRKISPFLNLFNNTAGNRLNGSPWLDFVCWSLPAGWFRQNQVSICRFWIERGLPLADLEDRTVSPKAAEQAYVDLEVAIEHPTPYNFWQCIFLPVKNNLFDDYVMVKKFARAQMCVDLARTACALERYRLAHGNYPESLDAITPQLIETIPHDIIGGQSLRYRRTDSGKFVLYSIGWNEKDDGGQVVLNNEGKQEAANGDWVWQAK